jgi:flagellar hook-associated protein 3 FlgL
MRITNNIMTRTQLDGLSAAMAALAKSQAQVTSGKRLQQASDDPTAAMQVMNTDGSLAALEQYRTNVQRASSRINVEDTSLQQLGDLLTRAKELAVSQATGTADNNTRSVANAEVQQLFAQVISIGNTQFGNEYIFGGAQSQTVPFSSSGSGATLNYTSTNPQGTRSVAIGDGQTIAASIDGSQLLLNSGVLDSMKALSAALDPASPTYGQAGITAAMNQLDAAFNALQSLGGDVGARGKQLDTTAQNLVAYKANLTTFKSDLQDVDVETAVTELTNRQMAYQAAMLATTKVMGLTLTDYLR